jgi:hypothetical protein
MFDTTPSVRVGVCVSAGVAAAEMTKLYKDMVVAVLASLELSAAEKKAAEEAIPFVVDLAIAEMDTNGDDKISLAEFTAAAHVFQFDN